MDFRQLIQLPRETLTTFESQEVWYSRIFHHCARFGELKTNMWGSLWLVHKFMAPSYLNPYLSIL